MKSVLSVLMVLLLVLLPFSDFAVSKEYPDGWDSGNEAHPWGGDETPTGGDVGDVNNSSYRSATIGTTGWLTLDIFLVKLWIKTYPTIDSKSGTYSEQSTTTASSSNLKTIQR